MKLLTLYRQTSTGATQLWDISVLNEVISIVYGQVDGKPQSTSEVVEGKNIGKKNETTPKQQAGIKAKQLWDKKIKEGYTSSLKEAQAGITNLAGVEPMLAQTYEDKPKAQIFPAFAQPKLDGHRCIAILKNGKCMLYSRTQKEITTVPHINKAIEKLYKGSVILDGELYNHELKNDFSLLTSLIKGQHNEPHPQHELMEYHVYDVVSSFAYKDRSEALIFDLIIDDKPLIAVDTHIVYNEAEMRELHDVFTAAGYEGLMYRNATMPYEHKRSNGLMKVKVFQDAEFEVIGVNEGKGKEAGYAVTYTCLNDNYDYHTMQFKATISRLTGPDGKFSETKEEYATRCAYILKHPEEYIGQKLTVQFQGRTPYGVPRFPVALRLRSDV